MVWSPNIATNEYDRFIDDNKYKDKRKNDYDKEMSMRDQLEALLDQAKADKVDGKVLDSSLDGILTIYDTIKIRYLLVL